MYVWEKHESVASSTHPTGVLACNSGVCPDRESNKWPFNLQDDAQPTEPHQSGQLSLTFVNQIIRKDIQVITFYS